MPDITHHEQTHNPLHRHLLLAPVRMLVATVPRRMWHPFAHASGWVTPALFPQAKRVVEDNLARVAGSIRADGKPSPYPLPFATRTGEGYNGFALSTPLTPHPDSTLPSSARTGEGYSEVALPISSTPHPDSTHLPFTSSPHPTLPPSGGEVHRATDGGRREGPAGPASTSTPDGAPGGSLQLRRTFGHFATFLGDSFCLGRVTPGNIEVFFSRLEGEANLRAALAAGRGAILVTPHLGLWELGGHALALAGFPVTVLSLRVADDAMNRVREEARRRNGIETLYIEDRADSPAGYLAAMRGVLARGRVLCMLADRTTSERPVRVRFAGHPALFPPGGPLLSLLTGAPLLAAFVVKEPGLRYRAWLTPPFTPALPDAARDERVADLCRQIADSFAQVIAAHPDQWYNFFPPWSV